MAEQPPATVLPGMQLVDDDDDDRLADFADGDRVGFVVYMNQYEAKISILAQRAQERRRRRQTSALVFLLFIVLSGLYLYSITRDTRGKYQLENARFAPIALVDSFGSSRSRVCAPDVAGSLGLARRHWWQMLSLRRSWGPRRYHNHPHRPRLRLDDSEQHHNDNDKPHHAANANDMVVVPGSHHAVKVVDGDAAVLLPEMPHRSNTNNATIDSAQICRNTAQGKWLVTDDRGRSFIASRALSREQACVRSLVRVHGLIIDICACASGRGTHSQEWFARGERSTVTAAVRRPPSTKPTSWSPRRRPPSRCWTTSSAARIASECRSRPLPPRVSRATTESAAACSSSASRVACGPHR